jgi:hypothetical protein
LINFIDFGIVIAGTYKVEPGRNQETKHRRSWQYK